MLGRHCKVGNFVKVKNSRLGADVKASHLSYPGDARAGRGVNVGAGTITANFDHGCPGTSDSLAAGKTQFPRLSLGYLIVSLYEAIGMTTLGAMLDDGWLGERHQ